MPKYPKVKVDLVGQDGNAFAIMGRVRKAMQRARISQDEIKAYTDEAMSGDYDHLLLTTMNWVSCDTEEEDCDEEPPEGYDTRNFGDVDYDDDYIIPDSN